MCQTTGSKREKGLPAATMAQDPEDIHTIAPFHHVTNTGKQKNEGEKVCHFQWPICNPTMCPLYSPNSDNN